MSLFRIGKKYRARTDYMSWEIDKPLLHIGNIYEVYAIEENVIWVRNLAKTIGVHLDEKGAGIIFNPLCPMASIKRRLPSWF